MKSQKNQNKTTTKKKQQEQKQGFMIKPNILPTSRGLGVTCWPQSPQISVAALLELAFRTISQGSTVLYSTHCFFDALYTSVSGN